jgi:hypothetical protein
MEITKPPHKLHISIFHLSSFKKRADVIQIIRKCLSSLMKFMEISRSVIEVTSTYPHTISSDWKNSLRFIYLLLLFPAQRSRAVPLFTRIYF